MMEVACQSERASLLSTTTGRSRIVINRLLLSLSTVFLVFGLFMWSSGGAIVRDSFEGVGRRSSSKQVHILVISLPESEHPNSHRMARHVLDGARSVVGLDSAKLLESNKVDFEKDILSWSDAVVVGSPVYMANPHPKILELFGNWNFSKDLSGKVGAAFVSGGGISGGQEHVLTALLMALLEYRMMIVGGERWTEAFGAAAVALFLSKAEGLGRRVASVTLKLNNC
ncbi:hypothetical protein NDN08_005959 [Rhodosorus marinus]|uniref:NADPH-dependent FMN reductase-like domain-containing protein n=1 Tax=Rhodosorus marinus TaxID=101924 RepID=A0AAV8UJU9_9RHOD|nr:hypothetical protein NDN08_005959 [Rhodosorus marinus]